MATTQPYYRHPRERGREGGREGGGGREGERERGTRGEREGNIVYTRVMTGQVSDVFFHIIISCFQSILCNNECT